MPADNFILIPLIRPGNGTGHLRRTCCIANELAADGKQCTLILENPDRRTIESSILHNGVKILSEVDFFTNQPELSRVDNTLILVDARSTSTDRLKRLAQYGCPILLDDDGPARVSAPFLVDCIPGPRHGKANQADTALLDLPPKHREPDPGGSILVCFGGEDPARLTAPVIMFLLKDIAIPAGLITTVRNTEDIPENAALQCVNVLESRNLNTRLHEFGLVICSYGLTAFEALAAGCAVITIEPSSYHAQLSRYAGFPGAGFVRHGRLNHRQCRRIKNFLANPKKLCEASTLMRKKWNLGASRRSLRKFISELDAPMPVCAACGSLLPKIIARFENRTYYRCNQCGITGLYRFNIKEDEYNPAYFEDEYKNQYGKTYLEDFQSIKTQGMERLEFIGKFKPKGRLLDIGCAFGPFLEAASEKGYHVYGIDVSAFAVDWVKRNLNLPALQGVFPKVDCVEAFGIERFDIVSLWYVIEHFPKLEPVFEKIASLMDVGGVLAISTPYGAGISARKSPNRFLFNSPRDHYTIWTVGSAGKLLKRWGFRIAQVRVTGHHPERICHSAIRNPLLFRLLMIFSRQFRLGDTFELYAVKVL